MIPGLFLFYNFFRISVNKKYGLRRVNSAEADSIRRIGHGMKMKGSLFTKIEGEFAHTP